MKKSLDIAEYALRTLAAQKESSVLSIYKGTILKVAKAIDNGQKGYYVGVKDTDVISFQFMESLEKSALFIHTKDAMAHSGRAIDLELINPITGRYMTGSSSGTALNVFKNINDLGVGTDGGGSVLAPALALNLYAMISPLFDQHALRKHSKTSTDGITFSPSIGFIAKDLGIIQYAIKSNLQLYSQKDYPVYFAKSPVSIHNKLNEMLKETDIDVNDEYKLSYEGLNRRKMIEELKQFDFNQHILVTCEGPIDLLGYGDSMMGHYDDLTQTQQEQGHKYYLKVVNMLGLSAFVVPSTMHAQGFLIICKSDPQAIDKAYKLAKQFSFKRSSLEENYFDATNTVRKDIL